MDDFLKKIWNYCVLYFHAFFYGMRSADIIISPYRTYQAIGTEHCISISSVWSDLLRGVLSEQVKQLRYSLYLINEKADEYKYIGNGICVKRQPKTRNKPIIEQDQREDTQNYTWALQQIENTDQQAFRNFVGIKPKKLINITYKRYPQLQFNDNIQKLRIEKKNNFGRLYMSMEKGMSVKGKKITKFLEDSLSTFESLNEESRIHFIDNNAFLGNIDSVSMKTYKCDGEYDDTSYTMSGVYVTDIRRNSKYKYWLEVDFRFSELKVENFFSLDKVFNKEQQEKYDRKEQKAETCIEFADAIYLCHRENEYDMEALKNLETVKIDIGAFV